MSASHFLRHLAIAYNHFHPIDEHRKFAVQLDAFEKKQLRESLSRQLDALEKRCRIYLSSGIAGYEDLSSLLERVKEVRGRLGVLSHESASVV